jgi:pimeloyl-ACP methyl ester carboxylesterase
MNGMQVIVDSLLTTYVREGKGRVVLLLHGWGDQASGLRNLQQALAKKYDVIALDLPGFGGTQPPQKAWGLSDYAAFIEHFLEKIDAKDVYVVLGHSNGGAIAIRALSEGRFGAEKLVLLASAGIRGVYKGRLRVLRIATKFGKALTYPLPKSAKNRLRHKAYKTIGSDMLVAEHLQETFKKVVNDDVRADAAKLDMPTLLIYGEEDEQAPPWYGETYRQLINHSTLEILPSAGHFVHLDRPQEVTRAIQEFIQYCAGCLVFILCSIRLCSCTCYSVPNSRPCRI